MAKPIGFSAFLKLLQLLDGPRKTELRKKLAGGGGFQYWRPIQLQAPKAIMPGADIKSLRAEIASLCSNHQKEYNENAFDTFTKWIEGKSLTPIESLPTIEADFGNSGLVVRLRPDVSFKLDGVAYSMVLWATTKPLLTVQALSVGLYFLAQAYKAEGHVHRQHLIFDTVSNQLFREADILPSTVHLLDAKVAAFKKDWDELNPAPAKPSGKPEPDQPTVTK